MNRAVITILSGLLLGTAVLAQGDVATSRAWEATPEAPAPVVISGEVLGRATPAAVEDAELALGRVTIMPGAVIPVHYHAGTQIGVVVQGELTYSVFTGEIAWHRGDSPDSEPYLIGPGETVVVRPGDALIESPGAIHQGRNDGDVPVVIYLSTLFPADAPRSVIVDATPVS